MTHFLELAIKGNVHAIAHIHHYISQGYDCNASFINRCMGYALGGNAFAQYLYGSMHSFGYGMQNDDSVAAYWYRKSAETGISAAQFMVGVGYKYGRGMDRDIEKAIKW